MLQTLRDKTSGWMATVILGILIVPFALVGVQEYFTRVREQPVATVRMAPGWWPSAPAWWPARMLWDDVQISQAEFRERLEQERQTRRREEGQRFDARAFDSIENKRRLLERMVDERVQQLWAEQHAVAVGNGMVRQTIAQIPAFQVNGRFDLQRYRLALSTMQPPRSEREFEELVRSDLQRTVVARAVGTSNFVTEGEFTRLVALMGERRDVSVLELAAPALDATPVTDAELQAWYRAHPQDFRAPETVTLEYVELNAATMPAPRIDEAQLRAQYERERSRFAVQEQRLASHILVEVPKDAPAAAVQAARAEAAKLAAQARAGGDFAALARASSDDPGSKSAGGDLGWVGRGMMAGPFEDTLFSMQAGQVSEPVRTEFGWHVIQLRQVQAGQQQSFEQAREALAAELMESERERAFNALSTRVVDAVLKNPSSLAPAAREAGLQVQRTGPIARGQGQGVIAAPAVQRVAFSESAIEDGMVSDPIEIAPNHSVLVRVAAHSPARTLPLAQVRERVAQAVRADRARKAQEQRAKALVARVQPGASLAQVAAAEGLPAPRNLTGVPRGAPVLGDGVAEAFFSAYPGKAGSRVLEDGRAIVFVVDRVQPGTLADLPPPQREAFEQQMADLRGLGDVESLVKAMRRGMKVEIDETNL
ncbi:MAG: peptidyl-prolyl cis-trans isomerase [Pseudomonadota bacterium]